MDRSCSARDSYRSQAPWRSSSSGGRPDGGSRSCSPRRLNRILSVTILASALISLGGVLAKPDSWFTTDFPVGAARATAAAAGPHGRVFATSPYADWVLWTSPQLAGRVAFDARFELL